MIEREHKVAVATVDGKKIAYHFGSAPLFTVYTVKDGRILDREMRYNCQGCGGDMEESGPGCWKLLERLLPDVRVVICGGIGENAYVGLLRRDVLPMVTQEEDVEKAVKAYLKGRLREDSGRVHPPRRGDRHRKVRETEVTARNLNSPER